MPPVNTFLHRARRWAVAALGSLVVLITLAYTVLAGGSPATLALSLSVPVAVSLALVGVGVWRAFVHFLDYNPSNIFNYTYHLYVKNGLAWIEVWVCE